MVGTLGETPKTGAQTSERRAHERLLTEHHVSDACTAGWCYLQRVQMAGLLLVAYRPHLEAKTSHFPLPLNFVFSPLSPIGQVEASKVSGKDSLQASSPSITEQK